MPSRRKTKKRTSNLMCVSPLMLIVLVGVVSLVTREYISRATVTGEKCIEAAHTVEMQKKQCRYCSCSGEKNRDCCSPEICANTKNCSEGESNDMWGDDETQDDETEDDETPVSGSGWFDWL